MVSGQGSFDKIIAKGVKHHLCGQPSAEDIIYNLSSISLPSNDEKRHHFTAGETEAQSSHGKLPLGP